jgi:hypothetical protein
VTSIPAIVRVEDVQRGDEVRVGKTGMHVVSSVGRFDTLGVDELENFVVVYFASEESTFENRARDRSGHNRRRRLVEKSLRPLERGATVAVVRGNPERADHLRDVMEAELAERGRATEQRWKHAAARDQIRAMQA